MKMSYTQETLSAALPSLMCCINKLVYPTFKVTYSVSSVISGFRVHVRHDHPVGLCYLYFFDVTPNGELGYPNIPHDMMPVAEDWLESIAAKERCSNRLFTYRHELIMRLWSPARFQQEIESS